MGSQRVKQLATIRRRAGLTVKEFLDYHYQQHGRISTAPTPEQTPLIYYQDHYFESAYASADGSMHPWSGHNDSTELYFKDNQHLLSAFGSEWVKTKVGPDAQNFSDTSAVIALFCREEDILEGDADHGIIANYHVQGKGLPEDASDLSAQLKPCFLEHFSELSTRIVANIRVKDEFNLLSYFQGKDAPGMSIVYTVYLEGPDRLGEFRTAQKAFEDKVSKDINRNVCFVCFGKRGMVLDQTRELSFDPKRQPDMKGLIGSF